MRAYRVHRQSVSELSLLLLRVNLEIVLRSMSVDHMDLPAPANGLMSQDQ